MPQSRLSPDDVDFIMNMKKVEYSKREIARRLKVYEGTVHYRIKREQSGSGDGRKRKAEMVWMARPNLNLFLRCISL